jgi:Zn-dependent oligopeptidase
LSSFINELNTDTRIYEKMSEIVNYPPALKSLTSEEVIFVRDMMAEFEAEGVHIKGKKERQAVASLQVNLNLMHVNSLAM